ncbi:MAG: MFS transporter, partial [Dehalococcoidia bacterium]|nr:MFS transporter [Dehalococcoidia bacterium]
MTAPVAWLGHTFASLKIRDFRLLWLGSASEHTGEWMERIAVGWLVLQMTNSPFMVGLTEFMRFAALLIFPFIAGATADRVDRKKLLIATLLGLSGISAVLSVLVLTDTVTVAHLLAYSFFSGVFIAFNHPA